MPEADESLEDLLKTLGSEQQMLAKCEAVGINASALKRLRAGTGHAAEFRTIHALATLLGVDAARVDRAVTVRRRRSSKQF
jgi:DNA-binding Xre family transcriptional regulator